MNSLKLKGLYEFGPFKLDRTRRRLTRANETLTLPRIAFDLLVLLMEEAGELKTREALLKELWPTTIVEENSLSWYMSVLRKTLGDESKPPRYIETVRGQGYRFIAPVTIAQSTAKTTVPPAPAARRKRVVVTASAATAVLLIVAGLLGWRLLASSSRPDSDDFARSIAVLPFENLSANPANAYFAAGIQDTLLTKLSSIAALHVISRTSTESYPSHPRNLSQIARELRVASVLEGSVQKSGNQVLINVQLIDAATDEHIWAHAYTRTLDNVFTVESSIAEQVAAALKAKLLPAERARVSTPPTRNAKAYDSFLHAEYLASRIERGSANASGDQAREAIELYRQALARDPDFDLARARLSYLNSYLYWFGLYRFDKVSRPKRLAAAQKQAREAINSGLPQAQLAMGYVYYWGDRDYAQALKYFKQALAGMPNNAEITGAIALIQRRQGHWQKALAGLRHTEALDPRNPRWYYELGASLAAMRRYDEAREQFSHALSIDPENPRASAYNALVWLLAGKPRKASQTLGQIKSKDAGLQGFISVLRFESAILTHHPKLALDIISKVSTPWVEAAFATGNVPTAALKGRASRLLDHRSEAEAGFRQAEELLRNALGQNPVNTNFLSNLGLVEAHLGNAETAINAARQAVRQLPVSADALTGPSHLVKLAATYARLGKSRRAVNLLERLLETPAGLFISAPLLRLDPAWDSIRQTPEFRKLLAAYQNN